jgi:hypothetical protein
MGGQEVGHVARLACGAYVIGGVGWDFVVEGGVLVEKLDQLAHQHLGLWAWCEQFGYVLDLDAKVGVFLDDVAEANAAEGFDFDLEG